MSDGFIENQQKKLLSILKGMDKSALFNHLNLQAALIERDWHTMYEEFSENVPLGNITSYLNTLRAITGDIRADDVHILSYPKIIENGSSIYAALHQGHAFPVNEMMLENSFVVEEMLQKGEITGIDAIKGKFLHIYDEVHTNQIFDVNAASFHTLRYPHAPRKIKKKILPNLKDFQGVGASRYQKIHAFIMVLEKYGAEVEAIFVRPQILSEIALVLAQREGRYIPLRELCPNLKLIVHFGENVAPYKQAIFEFLKGMTCQRMQLLAHPSGLFAYQENLYEKNVLRLSDHEGVFYEFIPVSDLRDDGSLKKHFRRRTAKDVKVGHQYVIAVSNEAGLLGFNTEVIVEIYSKDPFEVVYKGRSESLNYFGESINPHALELMIEELNKNFTNYNFFIREYLLSDHVDEHKSYWLFELSSDVQRISDEYLQSAANSIHNEMSLQNSHYRQSMLSSVMPLPEVYFLSVGGISNQSTDSYISHVDFDEGSELARAIIDSGVTYKKFTPKDV